MTMKHVAVAVFAFTGLAALAGCASGSHHEMMGQANAGTPTAAASTAPGTAGGAGLSGPGPEVTPALIRKVQTALRQEGLYKGRLDGLWGRRTERAVHTYQQVHKLAVSGALDRPTLAALDPAEGAGMPASQDAAPMPARTSSAMPPAAPAPVQ